MLIHLIRHTAVAAPGICYGHSDVPLADTFAAEAAALKAKLLPTAAAGFQVFSSPAARCRALAAEFATDTWENRRWAELPPAETEPWMADYVTLAPPQGETFRAVQERATAFLTELTTAAPETPVAQLVFSHGGTIRALVSACLELPLRNAFRLRIDYASVTTLEYQHGSWSLLGLNR
jgi:alpha-ribazole phosphatase